MTATGLRRRNRRKAIRRQSNDLYASMVDYIAATRIDPPESFQRAHLNAWTEDRRR